MSAFGPTIVVTSTRSRPITDTMSPRIEKLATALSSAAGAVVAEIKVPAELVTSVCFGGADLRTLYVLSGTNHEYPDPAGGQLFSTPVATTGLPSPEARVRLA